MTATEWDGRIVGLAVLLLGALLLLPLLTMGGGMMGGEMWGPGMGGGMWGGGMWGSGMQGGTGLGWLWLVGLLLRVAALAAIVALGYYLVRTVTADDGTDPAVAELREAYARGELTDEEYERRLDRLRETRNRY